MINIKSANDELPRGDERTRTRHSRHHYAPVICEMRHTPVQKEILNINRRGN